MYVCSIVLYICMLYTCVCCTYVVCIYLRTAISSLILLTDYTTAGHTTSKSFTYTGKFHTSQAYLVDFHITPTSVILQTTGYCYVHFCDVFPLDEMNYWNKITSKAWLLAVCPGPCTYRNKLKCLEGTCKANRVLKSKTTAQLQSSTQSFDTCLLSSASFCIAADTVKYVGISDKQLFKQQAHPTSHSCLYGPWLETVERQWETTHTRQSWSDWPYEFCRSSRRYGEHQLQTVSCRCCIFPCETSAQLQLGLLASSLLDPTTEIEKHLALANIIRQHMEVM